MTQAPLRQAVGNEGPITVTVPFSVTELKNCKATAGNYRDDPEKAAGVFEIMMAKTQDDPECKDIGAILQVLLDSSEKEMICQAARIHVEAEVKTGTVEHHFPSVGPNWDLPVNRPRQLWTRYQKGIIFGIQNAVAKAITMSEWYKARHDSQEPPTGLQNRMKEVARNSTSADPAS